MNFRTLLSRGLLTVFVCSLLSACFSGPSLPVQPTAISLPTAYNNNIIVRIDSVIIKQDDGDGGTGGEVYFAILATKEQGESAKLILPGNDTFAATVGEKIEPGKFSLTINDVNFSQNEEVAIYLIGFEKDSQSLSDETITNLALDLALEYAKNRIPGGPLVPYILEKAYGPALEWWREEDVLGEYPIVLNKENNWLVGQQYHVNSTNGNLEITFSILQNSDLLGQAPNQETTLTIINNTSTPIEKLYVSKANCSGECSWGTNLLTKAIAVGGKQEILVASGFYDLRAEGASLSWEKSALDLTINQQWIIITNQ